MGSRRLWRAEVEGVSFTFAQRRKGGSGEGHAECPARDGYGLWGSPRSATSSAWGSDWWSFPDLPPACAPSSSFPRISQAEMKAIPLENWALFRSGGCS
jgi:hypothetical protein